jgi:hypothetical protein
MRADRKPAGGLLRLEPTLHAGEKTNRGAWKRRSDYAATHFNDPRSQSRLTTKLTGAGPAVFG